MQIILIILAVLAVLFIILEVAIAKFFSVLMFTPPVPFRPTKEAVINNNVKEFASHHQMYSNANYEAYEKWEREEIALENDGVIIPGAYHPVENAKGCMILAHGFGQNRYAAVPYAEIFRNLGYDTIVYDERCFGVSAAPYGTFGQKEADDVLALAAWVRSKKGKDYKVFAHGVSMGAVSVMNAMGKSDALNGVIADCGFARAEKGIYFVFLSLVHIPNPLVIPFVKKQAKKLGIDFMGNNPVEAVAKSNTPLCIIHGTKDIAVNPQDAREIYAVVKHPKSRLEMFDGAEHAYSIYDTEKYTAVVTEFLNSIQQEVSYE